MKPLYGVNGLVCWTEREIAAREAMQLRFANDVAAWLRDVNPAWRFDRVEAPIMIPRSLISQNYTDDDLWVFKKHDTREFELVARPETTPSTYVYMVDVLQGHNSVKLPWCVWQAGKSFRAEQDKVLSHMRLKEFWQMEFQCAYAADSAMDYHGASLQMVRAMLGSALGLPTRVVASDRLPSYSLVTMDVEAEVEGRWMEVCSISKRTDFPIKNRPFKTKTGEWRETDVHVLEIAIGLDRCVRARMVADEAEGAWR